METRRVDRQIANLRDVLLEKHLPEHELLDKGRHYGWTCYMKDVKALNHPALEVKHLLRQASLDSIGEINGDGTGVIVTSADGIFLRSLTVNNLSMVRCIRGAE